MKENMQKNKRISNLLPMKRIDIMLDEVLPNTFSNKIWSTITLKSPQQFMAAQEQIMMTLLSDYHLFKSFFSKFYNNHLHLNNWFLLAHQNQQQIKQYIFKYLLAQSYKSYKDRVKDQELKNQFTRKSQMFAEGEHLKIQPKEKNKQMFHRKNVGKIKFQIKNKNRETQLCQMTKSYVQTPSNKQSASIEKQDYHELFLQTFNACDGSKYIYYDFNRHMQGSQQMNKYNKFIRVKAHKRLYSSIAFNKQNLRTSEMAKTLYPSVHQDKDQVLQRNQTDQYPDINNIRFSKFTMDPIGSIQKIVFKRQHQTVFRKMPNLFKRAKSSLLKNKFPLFRKKIL